MEFLAATKDGIVVYDASSLSKNDENGGGSWKTGVSVSNGVKVKVLAQLPSPDNAFGHGWSEDGAWLGSVNNEGIVIYDADDAYKSILELKKVAPDVAGRQGGVRNLLFSPKRNYLVTYEKWDPQYPENVHVWALQGEQPGKKLYSCTLKGYTSGALPVSMIRWIPDESLSLELRAGQGIVLRSVEFDDDEDSSAFRLIAEKNASNYEISPKSPKGVTFVAVYIPETGGLVAHVRVYDLANPSKAVVETPLPAKVKDAKMMWNHDGTSLLILANSDVDETGCSYFGTTYLYWVKSDGKAQSQVFGSKDGQVQDIAWSPTANEFAAIVGFQPAQVTIYDGKTGKLSSTLGKVRRNTLKWNRFGKLVAVGGFGTLAGDLDFFDRAKEETVCSLRAPLTVDCAFGQDGRHFLACTIAPRMNEDNQISVYKYTGELLFKLEYVPEHIDGRHEDTGAGARTKTQALLYAASWRPFSSGQDKYEDRAVSPPPSGQRRKKGLPEAQATAGPSSSGTAYRPPGAGGGGAGNSVAAMMRLQEMPSTAADPSAGGWGTSADQAPTLKPMEEWEIRKLEKIRKKEEQLREQQEKDAVIQARKDMESTERAEKKKLKQLKEQLAALDALKEKEWDELTEEDEEQLEGEVDLRAQIAELEKRVGGLD